jgi:ribosomal protein S18 acetylase RimI-like enzyme
MKVEPFLRSDIDAFLALAHAEGWLAERWEFEFLLKSFPQGCLVIRADSGEGIGFVTALRHSASGWIGNLIVADGSRGRGIGRNLFLAALQSLGDDRVQTIWLTASKAGQPLYQKYGFTRLDSINRWVGTGRQRHGMREQFTPASSVKMAENLDRRAWGDQRQALLTATAERGSLLADESGFVCVQPCGSDQQFGPFSALDEETAEKLFGQRLRETAPGTRIYMDSPASNRAAVRLFKRRGFEISGTCELMYAGVRPDYNPEFLYGLATLGSCG